MSRYAKVKGSPGLIKDLSTGAVLNVDYNSIAAAKQRKLMRQEAKQKQHEMSDRVDKLENELGDIKNLLNQLVEKL